MSRIILEKHDNGEPRYVVGWDRPCASYFWQEFNKEPEPDPKTGEVNWDGFEEMARYKGYMLNELPDLNSYAVSVPEDLKDLMLNDEVLALLVEHSEAPDAGRIVVDLSDRLKTPKPWQSFKVEVMTVGSDKWASNAVRFATMPEAEQAGQDLFNRWMACTEWRAVPSTDPVNYKWENGGAVAVR